VLYDAVLAVRRERPQLMSLPLSAGSATATATTSLRRDRTRGLQAAADPTVFPDQLKDGLQPWQPLAVYSMVPFAPITEKGIFDYATGNGRRRASRIT